MNSDIVMALIVVSIVLIVLAGPIINISLMYSRWWHRVRKYKYRIVQSTVMSHYNDEPSTYYVIQKKGWFRWKDKPEVPGYSSYDGHFSIWRTEHYNTLAEAEEWMDKITAILTTDGEKRDVRG